MDNFPNSFVALVLRMMGMEDSREALAIYFDAQFSEVRADSSLELSESPRVQAKSIALVEDAHLVPPLLGAFSLKASQNILNFAPSGELNVLVVREQNAPHSQNWCFTLSSNFNLFNSKHPSLNIKIQARFDRLLDRLVDLSIDKDEFDLEAYKALLEQYTQYHSALNPPKEMGAQSLCQA